ncbi:hypothetical protein K461DRAFT_233797 [Myriangium duriaei CBS 260.36]|uniref:Uncharacterized protein n=1 Tax=Myriangium duriaei CBS 260.36 TaxID=1168546 RepID=A0A9P4ISH8_9PEZI|nr:hypothetical protein K461DRAFT_233797 [Myriangium duriaei CBS 260.36]
MANVPAPDPRELLPPLLACLPTAFASPRPPPALLPLLSPILRQRVQYSSGTSGADGWLSLLSWDPDRASKLAGKVEGLQLEAHPVSGELEVEDVDAIRYRKMDEETLHARLEAGEFDLLPIYVWCETDTQGGGGGPGWKLSELRALEDREDGTEWHATVAEAEASSSTRQPPPTQTNGTHTLHPNTQSANDEDDDDDYWASYDRSSGPTPAKQSPAPNSQPFSTSRQSASQQGPADDDYYARYSTVQPALDSHDPDEEPAAATSESTLHGNTLLSRAAPAPERPVQRSLYPADSPSLAPEPIAPRPLSPASTSSSKSVERLEQRARTEADLTRAEDGVRRFIGTEIRQLFRLARSVGMDKDEFDECVTRELEVVGMLEDEV